MKMAGNASDARRQAETSLNNAKKTDPQGKNDSTKTLQAAYDAARSVELQQTGKNEQAKGFF
jgi:hypothetical protein